MITNIKNTNSKILVQTAQQMGIKVEILDKKKIKLQLTKDGNTRIVTKKSFGLNPSKAIAISKDKHKTHQILKSYNIPTPNYIKIKSLKELKNLTFPARQGISDPGSAFSRQARLHRLPFPLVIKPLAGEKAHNVYIGIRDNKTLKDIARRVLQKSETIIIQRFIKGHDLRLFVLYNKTIGAAIRKPPRLTGNGKNTIEELIHYHNQKLLQDRQKKGRRLQNRILNWDRVTWHLENQGHSLKTILPKGKTIEPYPISNFQAGGTVETIPLSKIHSSIIQTAEKAVNLIGLKVAGVDMIIPTQKGNTLTNLGEGYYPKKKAKPYIIEINSDPSLRLHEWPNRGQPQPVTQKLLNSIFSS